MRRRGFTLVELMIVVAVIAVLLTIVTTAASNAIHSSREKRTEAMRVAFQNAITTYQASDSSGLWPSPVQSAAEGAKTTVLTEDEAQRTFRIIVQKATGASGSMLPLIDPHGLVVAPDGATDGKTRGISYDDARQGDGHHRQGITTDKMLFGYQNAGSGAFYRFNIIYHAETDSITVHTESRSRLLEMYPDAK